MFDSDFRQHVPPHLRAAMERLRDPQGVWKIFRDRQTLADMERLTAHNRPAVVAVSAKLLALGDWVREHDAKKTFGKLARFIMGSAGYVVAVRGTETPEDPLFTKATRYRLAAPALAVGAAALAEPSIAAFEAPLLDRLLRVMSPSELRYLADGARTELAWRDRADNPSDTSMPDVREHNDHEFDPAFADKAGREQARRAAANIIARRKGVTLGDLNLKDLISEGRP